MGEMSDEKYVVVTTISMFRNRYVVPVSALGDAPSLDDVMIGAKDMVVMNEVHEFSGEYVDENIVDSRVVSEAEILDLFQKENKYLSDVFSREQVLDYIRNWKDD
jgi:hypothetical protein